MVRSKVLWCAVAMVLATVTLASAEDKVAVGVTADVFSKYLWRGQNIVDDWVLQPGASVGYQGLTGSVWGNLDLKGNLVDTGQLTEVDLALDYSNKVPGWETIGYSVGTIYYSFLNTHAHPTAEVYGGLSLDVPLSPAVRWYYDFDAIDGSYIQFSLGHTIEKIKTWTEDCHCDLQLGVSLGCGTDGYNNGYFGVDQGGLNDLTLTAGLPFTFGKLTIKPSFGYSMMIDGDIRDKTAKSDNFWGGIGAAYNF